MNIIYLSTFLPRANKEYYANKMHNYNFNSADTFSYSLFGGLAENLGKKLTVINVPPLGAFPRYNDLLYSNRCCEFDKDVAITTIANSNLYVYQYYSIYKNVLKELKLYKEIKAPVLLIYGINIPIIKAAIKFRNTYSPNSKIVLIVPDLLEDCMEDTINSKIKMRIIGDIHDLYSQMDGFVLLTEQMNEKIQTTKPYCIIEGIYNANENRNSNNDPNPQEQIIFYSGMLYEKFGVKTLLDAFSQIDNPNIKLQLCGCGELEGYIKSKQTTDSRREYLGLVSREDVLELQSKANLLVNPRSAQGEFTKYSFPSKNIEYLVSGIPTLIYKLPGIPSEYYDYCFSLDYNQITVGDLKDKILEILSLPEKDKIQLAERARMFIKTEKNSVSQTRKIINLIRSFQ